MERISLASAEPLLHSKLDEMVQIEGIAIEEGVWTDSLGRTLRYPANAIVNATKGFVGRPLILPHTEGKDDMKKVIGLVTETWAGKHDGKVALFYRGLISDEGAGLRVMNLDLTGNSVEADYVADPSTNPPTITQLNISACCLTDRPACGTCRVQPYPQRVSTIKLEGGKERLAEKNSEEVLENIKKIVDEAYPTPKTKTWGEMTKEEKMGSCTLFFKHSGYPVPTKFPAKTKDESGEVQWDFPEGFPDEVKNEILGLESKVTELQKEITKLQGEVTKRDTEEVNRLYNEIKVIDPDFSKDTVTKLEQCPLKQRTILQTYLDNLVRLKPKFSVGAVAAPSDVERMNKIALESFGMPLEELEKQLASEEKGGKS